MISPLRNKGLDNCWLAGSSIELFRKRTDCNTIDRFDVSQNCQKILNVINATESTTNVSHISWAAISQLVLGTARIYRIQVQSVYDNVMELFINRPTFYIGSVQRRFSMVSESKCRRKHKNSKPSPSQIEPKRGRYDCTDPEFISDFLNLHEETPEEDLLAQIAAPDRHTTRNSEVSLRESIPVQAQQFADYNYFDQATYQELEEFRGGDDERHRISLRTQITVEVHSEYISHRGRNATSPDLDRQVIRRQAFKRIVNQKDIDEILPADDFDDAQPTLPEPISHLVPELTPTRRRRFNATLDDAEILAKRRRICENIISQADINDILPANDISTIDEVQLTSPEPTLDSTPEPTRRRRSNSTQSIAEHQAKLPRIGESINIKADINEIISVEPVRTKRRIFNSTLADADNLPKRRRIWPNNIVQDEILPAVDTNDTNFTNSGVQLTSAEPTPIPEKQSIQRFKTPKKPFRDLYTELQMPTNFANLDFQSSLRHPNFIINIPTKLYNSWDGSVICTVPVISENSSNHLGPSRPIMANCLMNQYQRNLKTTKKSLKLKEKTLDVMTLLDDFFNKKPIELENLSFDECRSQAQPITSIAELDASLEQMELSSQSTNERRRSVITNTKTMSRTMSRTFSLPTCVSSCSVTQISDASIMPTTPTHSLTSITERDASLEQLELLSQTTYEPRSIRSTRTTSRSVSLSTYVSEQPSFSLSQISDKSIMPTTATTLISDITSARFVEELNILFNTAPLQLSTKIQIEWGPTGLLKKLYHLWNANCVTVDMKLLCRGASRKCAAVAFSSLLVLQSSKFQYVVLDKIDGTNTIQNIRRSDTLNDLFQEFLEK